VTVRMALQGNPTTALQVYRGTSGLLSKRAGSGAKRRPATSSDHRT